MGTNTKLIDLLDTYFFGEDTQTYFALVNSIIECKRLEEFDALNIDIDNFSIQKIFDAASRIDSLQGIMSFGQCKRMFNSISSVSTNVDFI